MLLRRRYLERLSETAWICPSASLPSIGAHSCRQVVDTLFLSLAVNQRLQTAGHNNAKLQPEMKHHMKLRLRICGGNLARCNPSTESKRIVLGVLHQSLPTSHCIFSFALVPRPHAKASKNTTEHRADLTHRTAQQVCKNELEAWPTTPA